MRCYNQRQMTRPLHPIANPIYRVIPNARANVREGPYDALGSAVACVWDLGCRLLQVLS